MILFMIKKTFFDMWDNMFQVVLLNIGFILMLSLAVFGPPLFAETVPVLSAIVFAVSGILLYVYLGAASMLTRDIADYQRAGFKEFFAYLKETWKTSAVFGLIAVLHILVLSIAIPVYGSMQNIFGLAALVFLLWGSLIWAIASQYYLPLRDRLDRKIRKIIKKCFILFFDNTFFSITLGIGAVAIFALSAFTAFLIPGIATVLLWWNVALKLRLYKYDYLEQNPGANRRRIPWDALLVEDRERVGKRTLKGMIFPWKE